MVSVLFEWAQSLGLRHNLGCAELVCGIGVVLAPDGQQLMFLGNDAKGNLTKVVTRHFCFLLKQHFIFTFQLPCHLPSTKCPHWEVHFSHSREGCGSRCTHV